MKFWLGVISKVFLVSFRRKIVKRSPPEENFGQANPPSEPEKIARYLVLSDQKNWQKIGGQKIDPLKTRFLDDSREVSRKNFESKVFGKFDFYCISYRIELSTDVTDWNAVVDSKTNAKINDWMEHSLKP